MSDPIYKNSTSLGNGKSDVIINTAGKVIVKVRDRYYTLNYNTESEQTNKKESEISTDLIILKTDSEVEEVINGLTKNSVIITAENTIYLYLDDVIYTFDFNNPGSSVFNNLIVNGKLSINGSVEIINNNLVKNLNAQYLDGNTANVFVKINLPQTISGLWTFANHVFFNKSISDPEQKTLLNFETSSLFIDNITVKNLNITSGTDSDDDISGNNNIKVDYIKTQTFIGEDSNIISPNKVTKNEICWNENWANGGDAIIKLIIRAVENKQLETHYTNEEDDSYSYYVNKLLDVSADSSFSNLITVNEHMFPVDPDAWLEDDENLPYKSYYYRPKNVDTEWVNTPYGNSSNAKIGIYDNWFDKNNYVIELSTFTGLIWNLKLSNNPYKIGEKVKYKTNFGIIYGLVTKSSGKEVVIITDGEDCDAAYDPENDTYESCYRQNTPITNSPLLSAKDNQSVIGNITGIENSIFGTLIGYGFTSENNCYFVNPGIALVNKNNVNYLKLTNKEKSFIGINNNNENFITIDTNGNCDMKRNKMYDINNYNTTCSFGPIIVNEDGSATIGSGDTQITISADGIVTMPQPVTK